MPATVATTLRARARRVAQGTLKRAAAGLDRVSPPDRGLVVLIYHRVGRRRLLEVDLEAGMFEDQMAALAASGRAVTLDVGLERVGATSQFGDVSPSLPGHFSGHFSGEPRAALDPVVVTFDDGTADFAEFAMPILAKYRVPAVLYLATDFVETGRSFPDDGQPLSWSAVADVVRTDLVTVGSHTHTHALLDRVDVDAAIDELDRSIDLIGSRLNVQAEHFAYPKALLGTAGAQAEIRKRFLSAAVAGTRPNRYGHTDAYQLARSPVQHADGMRWFSRKLAGGLHAEDDVRRLANRARYAGAKI